MEATQMVIGPSELEKRIMDEEQDKLERIERHIGNYLIQNYTGQKVRVPLYDNYEFKVRDFTLNKLLRVYNRSGWATKIEYDSGQNRKYIEFTRYKPKRKEQKKNSNLPEPDVSTFNK